MSSKILSHAPAVQVPPALPAEEAARKAEAEKMKSILTTEQFMQWSQMQQQQQMRMSGQRGHGPQAMHKGGKDGKKNAEYKDNCDKPRPAKDKKGKE